MSFWDRLKSGGKWAAGKGAEAAKKGGRWAGEKVAREIRGDKYGPGERVSSVLKDRAKKFAKSKAKETWERGKSGMREGFSNAKQSVSDAWNEAWDDNWDRPSYRRRRDSSSGAKSLYRGKPYRCYYCGKICYGYGALKQHVNQCSEA